MSGRGVQRGRERVCERETQNDTLKEAGGVAEIEKDGDRERDGVWSRGGSSSSSRFCFRSLQGLGFDVYDLGSRVWASGSGLRVWNYRVQDQI